MTYPRAVLLVLAFGSSGWADQASEPDQQIAAALSAFCHKERVAVMFPLDKGPLPKGLRLDGTVEGMRLLALATDTRWQSIRNVQVFTENWYPGTSNRTQRRETLADFLELLTPAELESLSTDGLRLGDLNTDSLGRLASLARNWPAAQDALTKGYPDRKVGISLAPVLQVVGNNGIARREIVVSSEARFPAAEKPKTNAASPSAGVGTRLGIPDPGKIDYGTGAIVPFEDVLKKASEVYGQQYGVDHRIRQARYFVSGSFDADAIQACIRAVCEPRPFEVVAPKERDKLDEILQTQLAKIIETFSPVKGFEGLSPNDLANGRVVSPGQLASRGEKWGSVLDSYGVRSNDRLVVKLGLRLDIQFDGTVLSGDGGPMAPPRSVQVGKGLSLVIY